jgi:hypothetical protein
MMAKQAMATMYGSVACVFVHPKPPFSTGSTSCLLNTLQA